MIVHLCYLTVNINSLKKNILLQVWGSLTFATLPSILCYVCIIVPSCAAVVNECLTFVNDCRSWYTFIHTVSAVVFDLSRQATSPLALFRTSLRTWPRTWLTSRGSLAFPYSFPLTPLRPCSRKVHTNVMWQAQSCNVYWLDHGSIHLLRGPSTGSLFIFCPFCKDFLAPYSVLVRFIWQYAPSEHSSAEITILLRKTEKIICGWTENEYAAKNLKIFNWLIIFLICKANDAPSVSS